MAIFHATTILTGACINDYFEYKNSLLICIKHEQLTIFGFSCTKLLCQAADVQWCRTGRNISSRTWHNFEFLIWYAEIHEFSDDKQRLIDIISSSLCQVEVCAKI